jgi:hypothetical protein
MLMVKLCGIEYQSAYSNWMNLALNYPKKNKELAIYGEQALVLCTKTNSQYIPNVVLSGTQRIYIAFFKFPLPKP